MRVEGRVGPANAADGALESPRLTRDLGLAVGNLHPFYAEAMSRGKVFAVSNAVAGVAPGTALGTAPPIALWNPPSSGVILVPLLASMHYVSGTLGAGLIALAYVNGQTSAPTGGASLVPVNGLVGGQPARGVGQAFTGSTVAATPAIIRGLFTIGAALASSVFFPQACKEQLDGECGVAAGNAICLQGIAAAGTTPLVIFSIVYEEVPA